MPKCEICHEKFSAVIKIGKKKVCVQLLWEKIKQMRKWEIFISFVHVTVFLFCVFTILMAGSVLYSRLTFNNNINNNSEIK